MSERRSGGFEDLSQPRPSGSDEAARLLALEQEAQTHLSEGRHHDAEQLLRQLVEAGTSSASAHCNLAALRGMRGDTAGMVELLRRALELKPDYPEALSNLGIALQGQGQTREAIAAYRKALEWRPDYPEALCNLGSTLQDQGELEEAIALHQRALACQPDYPEAHFCLGLAHRARGDLEASIASFRQALACRPHYGEALLGLSQALRHQGDLPGAIEACRQALALQPDHAENHCRLANLLRQADQGEEAILHYRQALTLEPSNAEALVNLGITLRDQGDLAGAIQHLNEALVIRPDFVEALSNLGIALQENGDSAAAVAAYRRALALDPDFAPAHSNLGISLTESGALEEAIAAFRRAIALEPDFAEAYSNLGIALEESGDLEASIAAYHQALAIQPDYPEPYCNLGNALQELGDLEACLSAYRQAITLRPHYPDAQKNLSMAILLSGDYANGWQAYEWRFQSETGRTILNALPRGEPCRGPLPPPGASLLLVSEQGFGDTLQFMRYALPLRQRGLQVRLCAPAKLHGLIRASGLDPEPLDPEQVHGRDVGTWLPLLSLPGLLGVSAAEPLVNQPYLRTTDELRSKWARILADEGGPIVALNWQGNPEHEKSTSKGRSLPLEAFAPLAKIDGVRFLALQKGPGSEQLDACSFRDRFVRCQPLVSDTWDFLETAAMIANCDLVISSDTSAAHLAAGLGQETWLLLKHIAEWRWGLEGERSGWYPTMRLFRQRSRGAWGELMERVAAALEQRLAGVTTAEAALRTRQETEGAAGADSDAGQGSCDAPAIGRGAADPARDLQKLHEQIRRGDLAEAERLCRSLLSRNPADSEAMAILALLCEASGQQNERLQWLRRLSELRPENAADHYNLGVALQQQGHSEACISAYTRALSLQPEFPEALGNLGVAQQACGDLQAAIRSLQRAVALRPQFSDALSNLGNALQQQGDRDGAIDAYERALASRPAFPEALSNLATAYKEKTRLEDALACCQRALELKPDYPEALSNLGNILQAQWQEQQRLPHGSTARPEDRQNSGNPGPGRLSVQASAPAILQELAALQAQEGDLAAAIAAYRRALSLRPNYANAHYNLGIAYKDQDRLEEAAQCYERAISLKPGYADAHTNLGNVWQELGEIDSAVEAYQRAISYQPDHPAANKNLSMAWLLQGNYRQGWPHYEWRFRDSPGLDLLFAHPSIPRWEGTPLAAGARLILIGEQGLGDILQFMRYVPPLRQQGLNVSLCAVEKLHGLIQMSGIDAEPLTPGQANQLQDGTWLPLLSLPGLLGVSPEHPQVSDPYIRASEDRIEAWRRRLDQEQRPIIGINWQGNPDHERTNSRGRSLPLEAFAPLARLTGISLLSLQKGHGSEQLETCSFRDRFVRCQAQVDAAWDFVETAAILANCDLVITSDTAVAHLAGGMGRPTWLLLKHVPEWRWGLTGERSFWYDTMRLFRQTRRGDWTAVIARVARALKLEI